ncbi:hypothetical protein BVX97_00515 [bacterium E08(2017)]|nr:hypothetical protein BVX97_00515 [bacterium E08(2017)]
MSNDLKAKIQSVLKDPQLGVLATIKDDAPWCRYVFIQTSEDLTIRCATFKNARKVNQIEANDEVHITAGITSLTDIKPYLQIQAKATLTTDQAEKDDFWNPGLEEIFEDQNDPNFAVLIMKPYKIEYCSQDKHVPEVLTL